MGKQTAVDSDQAEQILAPTIFASVELVGSSFGAFFCWICTFANVKHYEYDIMIFRVFFFQAVLCTDVWKYKLLFVQSLWITKDILQRLTFFNKDIQLSLSWYLPSWSALIRVLVFCQITILLPSSMPETYSSGTSWTVLCMVGMLFPIYRDIMTSGAYSWEKPYLEIKYTSFCVLSLVMFTCPNPSMG